MKFFESIEIKPFDFVSVTNFIIVKAPNQHFRLFVEGIIKDCANMKYTQPGRYTEISVRANDRMLFNGIIENMKIKNTNDGQVVTIKAVSGSKLFDNCEYNHSYQDKKMKYADIHKIIERRIRGGSILDVAGGTNKIDRLIIQYHETNWEFLKRLASQLHVPLLSDYKTSSPRLYFGLPQSGKASLIEALSCKTELGDITSHTVESYQFFEICDSVSYNDREYMIYKVITQIKNSEVINTYTLINRQELNYQEIFNEKIRGVSLTGTVTGVKEDILQVELDIDKQQGKYWFKYSTVYSMKSGSGWYAMPEIGDRVHVYIPSHDESEAYSTSVIHEKSERFRENPEIKRFRNKYGREVIFAPKYIAIKLDSDNYIKMTDSGGIDIVSDKNIKFQSECGMEFNSREDINILAQDGIRLRQGPNSIIILKDISFIGDDIRLQ